MSAIRATAAAALVAVLLVGAAGGAWAQKPPGARRAAGTRQEAERLKRRVGELAGAGRYDEAIALARQALELREKALGPDHPDVAADLSNLASLYKSKGDFARAEPLFERALRIEEKALGPDHPDVATSLSNLAGLYQSKGDFARAEPLFERALRIDEKALGPDHPEVATDLSNLASLYKSKGDFGRAEPLFERALRIEEKALGPDHPDVATDLSNLAGLYDAKGDFTRAEPLFERALHIKEKALGPDHLDVATDLGNLAGLYQSKGDFARAEPLFERALHIKEKALGPDHPDVATSLNNLAGSYRAKGDFTRADPLFERALRIREKALGPDHLDVATSLNNLAGSYRAKGDFARAEALYEGALRIREKALGPDHPAVATVLANLASLYESKGDHTRAVAFKERANDIEESVLARVLAGSAEAQKQAFFRTLSGSTDSTVSLHVRSAPGDARAARLALTTLLRRKGRVLDATMDLLGTLRRKARPEDQPLLDSLQLAKSELSTLTLRGPGPRESVADYQTKLAELVERARAVEEQLARRYAELRTTSRPIALQAVQQTLREGQALVELAIFEPFDPKALPSKRWGAPHYVAYVLKPTGAPHHVELGDAAGIDAAVKDLRAALASRSPAYASLARRLDQQVTAKLRPLLGDVKDVLLSPDGALGMVPFAALVDEQSHFLAETLRFTYLSSGRDLLRLQDAMPAREAALVLAAPDYDSVPAQTAPSSGVPGTSSPRPAGGQRSVDFGKVRFPPLPGTAVEATALARILAGAHVHTGTHATKAALSSAHGPKILHVATHGFFLEDIAPPPAGADVRGLHLVSSSDAPRIALSEDPLLRAGLALAGANLRQTGKDDGVLTALEATSLDLWGTKLVTLSACETGVGEVKNGDGIYGLRRALVLSGAEAQMMSLWKVDDSATEQLMTRYYGTLLAGGGRSDALREVQLDMMTKSATAHPYYWASFIVSGDARTLEGKAPPAVRAVHVGAGSVAPVTPGARGSRGCGCDVAGTQGGSLPGLGTLAAAMAVAAGRRRGRRGRRA